MKIVLDTNVLVSAAISAYRWLEEGSGPTSKEPPLSLKIIGSVLSDILTLVVTEDIQNEYVAVMARKRFGQIDMAENKMPPEWFDRMLTKAELYKNPIAALFPKLKTDDPDDFCFLLAARNHKVPLVTTNVDDFPVSGRDGVEVLRLGDLVVREPRIKDVFRAEELSPSLTVKA